MEKNWHMAVSIVNEVAICYHFLHLVQSVQQVGYRLDNWGIRSQLPAGQDFVSSTAFRLTLGGHLAPVQVVPGSTFLGLK
jgi:hypothetical protein